MTIEDDNENENEQESFDLNDVLDNVKDKNYSEADRQLDDIINNKYNDTIDQIKTKVIGDMNS